MRRKTPLPVTLLYCHDALCGWCYGFSPVLQSFVAEYAADFTPVAIAGGMITGPRIGPIGEVAPYIKTAYRDVERRTGVTFGEGFLRGVLEEGTTVFTSIPPARALAALKTLAPDRQLTFAHRVQTAIYHTGIDPSDEDAYAEIATDLGVDEAAFRQSYTSTDSQTVAERDFALCRQLGVTGFPTVVLAAGDRAVAIARGYVPRATLVQNYLAGKRELAG